MPSKLTNTPATVARPQAKRGASPRFFGLNPHIEGQPQRIEAVIARIAAGQHGVVARAQLLGAGFGGAQVDRCIRIGLLCPIHRGIYLVAGGSELAHACAAILACRPRALLGNPTATHLWGLPVEKPGEIHVVVVGRTQRAPNGLRVRSVGDLPDRELRRHRGLPITSPSLTILDAAGSGDEDQLIACVHEARAQRIVTHGELLATLAAHPTRRGARALRRLLEREGGVRVTRSQAERRTLKVLRAHGLEPDASDYRVGPYRLDFYFAAEGVAVEFDSRQFHDNAKRFVTDRRRMAYLAARGILTFPLTAHDIGAGANRAMADLRATLERRRP